MRKLIALMLAVLMLASFAVIVSAEPSPTTAPEYQVTVIDYGTGEAVTGITIVPDGEDITISPNPQDDREFIRFEIEGDYEIISGALTGPTITIKPKTDVVVTVVYDDTGDVTAPPTTTDHSAQTGVGIETWMVVVFAVLVIGAVGVIVATKRLAGKKN